MFPRQAKLFIQKYAFLAACVGMAITGLTVLSFLVDIHRFRFPERSIFYIAACQLLYVVPYFARRFLNHEQMACNKIGLAERMILVDGGLDNSVCVVSAVFTHYFWTAGCLWWLMLTFTWYLSASRKWVQEEIEKRATYLHLISWGVAAFSTIFVLITQNVDANELTGICGVGFLHFETFVGVVVAPQLFILLFGLVFAILGFGSLRKQKQCFKHRGTDTSKLDKFITKMSLFTLIYVLTMVAVLIGDGYHAHILRKWYPATIGCKMNGGADRGMCRRPPQPEVVFYVVRTLRNSGGISVTYAANPDQWKASKVV
uniref:G-protein coupled receptors family 2 profile 2 domain-containing protein n=1 Tax=Panagrolaimus sp. JU765 TaxID=591449 RepID=A0AC34RBX0_9BILA